MRRALRERAARDTEAGREVDLHQLFVDLGGAPTGGRSGRLRIHNTKFLTMIRDLGVVIPARDSREFMVRLDPQESGCVSLNAFLTFLNTDESELYVVHHTVFPCWHVLARCDCTKTQRDCAHHK